MGGHIPEYDCAFVGPATKVFAMAVQGKTRLVAIVDDDDSVRSALHGMLLLSRTGLYS
jgi:hypothetical protein